MAQVAEYKIGNTTIRVFDDAYAGKSQVAINETLCRISRFARRVCAGPGETTPAEAAKPNSQRP